MAKRSLSTLLTLLLFGFLITSAEAQIKNQERTEEHIYLDSKLEHGGDFSWWMKKAGEINATAEVLSDASYLPVDWMPAIVPGTVLHSLVSNKIYPEPYFGLNNKLSSNLIPDIAQVGRDFYTYWFRTEFTLPAGYKDKTLWLQTDGINYRAEVWLNGHLVRTITGMFMQDFTDITDFAKIGAKNVLAVKVYPVDVPGTNKAKPWAARGENRNGGDGNIGLNTTMLMSVGWDFTFKDGIRDRNTGIWRSISIYPTGKVELRHPFVRSRLSKPDYDQADETISVELSNASMHPVKCKVTGELTDENIHFEKIVNLIRGENQTITFTSADFPELKIRHPRLWWPRFKGNQELYQLRLRVTVEGQTSDSLTTRFGIRDIVADRNTPDSSKTFYINGKKIFIRGANWIPEGMLRNSDSRMYAELRYTQQSGINLLRLWGGGIAESDYFYQLCDEFGILIWQEFWLTGDTKHPQDTPLYLDNLESTIKRIRNHPSLIFYVSSNESTEVSGARERILATDNTRPYQMQSECDGVHDGSPYQQVNPMQHYENTASSRGSRIDGFNPEYGAPTLPTAEVLRETMAEKDLWPINKEVWDYLDGNGFHQMTTKYKDLVNNYGPSNSIDEFAEKAQLLGAMNSKSIWEVWNYNKFGFGDRYCSGLLFWYLNCPVRQVCGRMWDWSLEPTASLYHTQNALEPLHAQFDYLKNTVSIYNDYLRSFRNYRLVAEVYDLDSKKISSQNIPFDIPEDAVAKDLIKLTFGPEITPVHFISLRILDDKGKEVARSFYWRSSDKYLGKTTLTGPAAGGFESLGTMKKTELTTKCMVIQTEGNYKVELMIRNPTNRIAFFTRLQLLDADQKPVRPSFYSDNFFSLLPGETKHVAIETAILPISGKGYTILVNGWNVPSKKYQLSVNTKK